MGWRRRATGWWQQAASEWGQGPSASSGQGLVEYAFILAAVVLLAVAALTAVGVSVADYFQDVADGFPGI